MHWGRLWAVVPALGLGWVSVYAVGQGTASTVAFDAGQQVSEWAAGAKTQPTPDTIARLRFELEKASGRAPANPAVHELLGLLHARSDKPQEYVGEAGVHFLRAVELRPSSPGAWANIAVVRYRAGDTGRIFEAALVRAARLGRFEPEVQRVVADYGLAVYDEVAPATRGAIDSMIAAGMKRKPMEILQIAQRRGRLHVACSHLAGSPRLTDSKWTQLCQSLEPTP